MFDVFSRTNDGAGYVSSTTGLCNGLAGRPAGWLGSWPAVLQRASWPPQAKGWLSSKISFSFSPRNVNPNTAGKERGASCFVQDATFVLMRSSIFLLFFDVNSHCQRRMQTRKKKDARSNLQHKQSFTRFSHDPSSNIFSVIDLKLRIHLLFSL